MSESADSVYLVCFVIGSAVYLERAEAERSLRMRSVPGYDYQSCKEKEVSGFLRDNTTIELLVEG